MSRPVTREEIYKELEKGGYCIGIKLPITVMPILKTSWMNEEDYFIYLLTLNEIPCIQGLKHILEQAVVTLDLELEKRKTS